MSDGAEPDWELLPHEPQEFIATTNYIAPCLTGTEGDQGGFQAQVENVHRGQPAICQDQT